MEDLSLAFSGENKLDFSDVILNALSIPVYIIDQNNIIIKCNTAFVKRCGLPYKKIINQSCYDVICQSEELYSSCIGKEAVKTGKVVTRKIYSQKKQRWLENTAYPMLTAEGNVKSVIISINDVTERENSLHSLQKSEENYRLLFERIQEGLVITIDNQITHVNPAFANIYGGTIKDLVGKGIFELIHPEDRMLAEKQLSELPKTGELAVNVYRIYCASGSLAWIELRSMKIKWNNQNGTLYFVQDVTERKNTINALQKSEENYRLLFENIQEGLAIAIENKVVHVNRALAKIYGAGHESMIGKSLLDFIDPKGYSAAIKRLKDLPANELVEIEYQAYRADGSPVWIEVRTMKIKWEDNDATLTFVRDITERKSTLEALQKSEENYRLLFERIQEGIIIVKGSRIIHANPAMNNIYGGDIKNLIGKDLFEVLHPDGHPIAIERLNQLYMTGELPFQEYRAYRANGSIGWIETGGTKVRWEEEDVILYFVRDITERKNILEALQKSEENYRLLFERIQEGLLIAKGSRIVHLNPAFNIIYGGNYKDLIGKDFLDFVHAEDHPIVRSRMEQVPKTGDLEPQELRLYRADGSMGWIESRATRIKWEGQEATLYFVRDITKQKEALEELRKSEENYRLLFENIQDGLLILADRLIIHVNPSILRIYGGELKDVIGRDLFEFVYPDDRSLVEKCLKKVLETGTAETTEYRCYRADSSLIWVESKGTKIKWKDQDATLHFIRDVTDRKNTLEAIKKSEENYRLLFETIQEGLVISVNNIIVHVNPAIAKLQGTSTEDFIGRNVLDFIHSEERSLVEKRFKTLSKEHELKENEYRIYRTDDSIAWIEARSMKIKWGNQDANLTFIRDITEQKNTLEALQKSEENYRLLFENIQEGLGIAIGKKFIYVNPVLNQMYKGDLMNTNIFERLHPDDLQLAQERFKVLVVTGDTGVNEYRVYRADDSLVWVELRGMKVKWQEQDAILYFIRDVTEKKQTQEKIKQSEERFRKMFETIPEGIASFLIDQSGEIICTGWNTTAEDIFGLKKKDILSRKIGDVLPKEFLGAITSLILKAWELDETITMPVTCFSFAGKNFWLENLWLKGYFYRINNEVIGIFREVSEIIEAKENSRVITEMSYDPIISFDSAGCITFFNNAAEKLFGYKKEEVMTSPIIKFFPPQIRQMLSPAIFRDDFIKKFNLMGKTMEVELLKKSGEIFPAEISMSIIPLKGGNLFNVIVRDISEKKKLEEQKSNFINSLSHELKTPLVTVLGYSEVLGSSDYPEEVRQMAREISSSGQKELKLVEDLLMITRFDAGSGVYNFTEKPAFELFNYVFKKCEFIARDFAKKNYKVLDFSYSYNIDPQLKDVVIYCDEDKIASIVENLVINSVKFSPKNRIQIDLEAKLSGEIILLTVADKGYGIPESEQQNIFNIFYQIKRKDTAFYEGLGTGLHVVKRYVEKHGGILTLESVEGSGTAFYISLPAKPAATGAKRLDKIMLVEDDQQTARFISFLLKKQGVQLLLASTPAQAYQILEKEKPEVVLLDIKLSAESGIDVCSKIKTQYPELPVLYLSAKSNEELEDILKDSPADGFIRKPFNIKDFMENLHRVRAKSQT